MAGKRRFESHVLPCFRQLGETVERHSAGCNIADVRFLRDHVRVDEFVDAPGSPQKLGRGGRLPRTVRTGDHEKIRHAAIFSFEIKLLTASLRPWKKTCSMKVLRRIAKKDPKEPLEMLGRPLPNQSAPHPQQSPQ